MVDSKVAFQRLRHAEVQEFVSPKMKTDFEMILENKSESIYDSSKNKKLGKGRLPISAPAYALKSCFGIPTDKSQDVRKLMYPFHDDAYSPCSNYKEFHDLSALEGKGIKCCGINTKCDSSGGEVRDLMHWRHPKFEDSQDYIIAQQRKQYKELLSEYLEDLPASSEGLCYHLWEQKDPSHSKDSCKIKKCFKSKSAILGAFKYLLRMKHRHHYEDAQSAFKAYDLDNTGKISAKDVNRMCQRFGIVVPYEIIEDLISNCDKIDGDGLLSFEEFKHYLNWRESNKWDQGDTEIACPNLIKNYYTTITMSSFNKYDPISSQQISPAGLVGVRVDLPQPLNQKVSDLTDYGESSNIRSILQPSVFQNHAIFEIDLVTPLSKYKMEKILLQEGVVNNLDDFNFIWEKVSCDGKASIEDFLNAMSEVAKSLLLNCDKCSE